MSTAAMAQESEGPSYFGGVDESALAAGPSSVACRLVALVPSASSAPKSPVAKGEASWLDVMLHEAVKIRWSDPRLELKVIEVSEEGDGAAFDAAVAGADALVAVAFGSSSSSSSPSSAAAALSLLSRPSAAAVRTIVPLGCEGAGNERLLQLARINGVSVFATTTTTTTTTEPENNSPPLPSRPLLARLPAFLSGSRRAFDAFDAALSFWSRAHSDDALTALLVVADATGRVRDPPLAALDSLRGQGAGTLLCMLRNCRSEVVGCVTDDGCKRALDCLTAAPPGDQVAAYRCIVSHESRLFEDFSLCVLTKNRCLGVSAEPPRFPRPRPQAAWRGREMTHETAEALFIGWREKRGAAAAAAGGGGGGGGAGAGAAAAGGGGGGAAAPAAAAAAAAAGKERRPPLDAAAADDSLTEPWSWRVCAGQNPAYDQFNCQYQIFYRGRGKGVLWYVPVFNVETLGGGGSGGGEGGAGARAGAGSGVGERVWRRRKYRVKRGEVPGTFWFSVLDNGKKTGRREERRTKGGRRRAERKKRKRRQSTAVVSKKEKNALIPPPPPLAPKPFFRRRLQGVLDHRLRPRRPGLRPLQLQRRRERGRPVLQRQRAVHARRRVARSGEARAAARRRAEGGRGQNLGAVPGQQRLVRGGAAGDRGRVEMERETGERWRQERERKRERERKEREKEGEGKIGTKKRSCSFPF